MTTVHGSGFHVRILLKSVKMAAPVCLQQAMNRSNVNALTSILGTTVANIKVGAVDFSHKVQAWKAQDLNHMILMPFL